MNDSRTRFNCMANFLNELRLDALLTAGVLAIVTLFSCEYVYVELPETSSITCVWDGSLPLVTLDSICCPDEFSALAGTPIMPTLSDVQSVKVVYEIATGHTWFVASSSYELHFDFCREQLGYTGTHRQFNDDQYGDTDLRLYYLGSVNHYRGADMYALQFFADDRIPAEGIATLYREVKRLCWFGDSIAFLPNSTSLAEKTAHLPDIAVVNESVIYEGQRFQALNPAAGYGYLKRLPVGAIDESDLSRHDIIVTDGVPIDLPVIAGIITTAFQTPLSHVNVLSHNRGTPNLAWRDAWNDGTVTALEGKLVRFVVTADTFYLVTASAEEAAAYWNSREPQTPRTLVCHDDTAGLFPLSQLGVGSAGLVGAKAANLAEIAKLMLGAETMPVPEGAFAIPFYYYRRHCRDNGIDTYMKTFFGDERFAADAAFRASALEQIRDTIETAPLDKGLVAAVIAQCGMQPSFTRYRFRSSTNVEDIEGFNGAGLYESHAADISKGEKEVAKTIREVFASLWTLRGFEEREYFKIDEESCGMGILVHRAFENEEANGVAVTANIYQPYVPAYTVNVQIRDISVVLPPAGFLSDQLLIHVMRSDWKENPVVEFIAHSNVNFGDPVLSLDETLQLARWLEKIKDHYYLLGNEPDYYRFAMDVEFKFDGPQRKLYIKQVRPYNL